MNKVILMSIQPKWLCEILNGRKAVELRNRFPKDYRGRVYLYCTKGKTYLVYDSLRKLYFTNKRANFKNLKEENCFMTTLNGKVVGRVWVDNVEELITLSWDTQTATLSEFDLSVKSCVSIKDLNNDFNEGYAIHFSKFEIFDKPKELREFSIFKRETIYCGMDCPPYTDWVEYRVRKAPQSWQYAYVEDNA